MLDTEGIKHLKNAARAMITLFTLDGNAKFAAVVSLMDATIDDQQAHIAKLEAEIAALRATGATVGKMTVHNIGTNHGGIKL